MTAAVVAHRRADVFRHLAELREQVLHAPIGQLGVLFQRGVQLCHVAGVVFAVMDTHSLLIDMRLKRFEVVWELGEFVCHDASCFDNWPACLSNN